ncbi:Aste57867_23442 [Aphanomyces stellatus]|uniref:Aste57867_23442 protein n=1 Tax=Aphanomyces stellatus TaxID=120398 RepID=A0A485LMN2_9STRA|nr:hypothetical protein As57867_023371 [Aphanomyces stellatus]VFU00088.1 Aste57867_23442 [Aphanomyces stellatus]
MGRQGQTCDKPRVATACFDPLQFAICLPTPFLNSPSLWFPTMGQPFLTFEDLKMCFSLCCCVYGIGTLGMPGNYARAGYGWATAALLSMASVNIYATVCISKLMLAAPKSVRTFGDLGEFVFGRPGRWLISVILTVTCFLGPIAFLVLGGVILTILFPHSYQDSTWIVLMGLTLLPVCLIPTLKEGAGVAAAGFFATLVADVFSLYMLVSNMDGPATGLATPSPNLSFKQVASAFGNLALAYGAGVVIPALQREHSEPTRMPRIIVVSMGLITLLFLVIAITGVSIVGCQIPGNLLFAIAGSSLGFSVSRGGVVVTYLCMQLHITIAFSVIIFPAFYTLEGFVLGIHKTMLRVSSHADVDAVTEFALVDSPSAMAKSASMAFPDQANDDDQHLHEIDSTTYKQPGVYVKVALLRTAVVAALVVVAVVWKDHVLDLLDFLGASCVSLCCMVIPMVLYLKHFGASLHVAERVLATIAIVASLVIGAYVAYESAGPLFNPGPPPPAGPAPWDAPKFPYCSGSYVNMVYTNVSYHKAWMAKP